MDVKLNPLMVVEWRTGLRRRGWESPSLSLSGLHGGSFFRAVAHGQSTCFEHQGAKWNMISRRPWKAAASQPRGNNVLVQFKEALPVPFNFSSMAKSACFGVRELA